MSLKFGCFVTGTDTDVGKTLVASALLIRCVEQGWHSVGMKPVAAGCTRDEGRNTEGEGVWRNADVEQLMAVGNVRARVEDRNPYCFREAIAPHLAAAHENRKIEMAHILACFSRLKAAPQGEAEVDAVVVEGAGGFLVPLGEEEGEDSASLAKALGLPVILVVGMRLGCLNHALLTQEAILARGLEFAGWVANRIDPAMSCPEENLATLKVRLRAPLLGVVPYLSQTGHRHPRQAAEWIHLPGF